MVLEWLADPLAVPHASLLQGKLSNRLGGGVVLLTAFESVITSHFIRQRPSQLFSLCPLVGPSVGCSDGSVGWCGVLLLVCSEECHCAYM